jgi:hypothetical protein
MIFFKLHFLKLYDKVSWDFLFLAMRMLGFAKEFLDTVKLLFQDAKSSIYCNSNMTPPFQIKIRMLKQEGAHLPHISS